MAVDRNSLDHIRQVPTGWESKKLREIGTFTKGRGIRKDQVLSEGVPWVAPALTDTEIRYK
jgi:hypothetical protein